MASSKKHRASAPPQAQADIGRFFEQGLALHREGRLGEAARLYRTVLQKSPDHADALNLLGVVEYQQGDFAAAARLIARAVRIDPGHAPAHSNLGNALHRLGRLDEAIAAYDRALGIRPDYAAALFNRGNVFLDLKRWDAALAAYDRALAATPGDPEVSYNRGNALMALDRFVEALAAYDAALAARPNDAEALCNRGNALYRLRRPSEALASYDRALRLRPNDAGTHYNRGQVLLELGQLDAAVASYDRALALKPDDPNALYNRGETLAELRRYDEAAASFERLLAVAPRHDYAQGELLSARMACCDWRDYQRDADRLIEAVMAGRRAAVPFWFMSICGSPETQRRSAATYTRDKGEANGPALWTGQRYRHGKIRLAYLSATLHDHAVSQVMVGMFEAHDRARFETTAISFGPNTGDALRQRLEGAFDRFLDVQDMPDREVAATIRGLEADIAIDLQGYTHGCRPAILALRPAPVQVSHLGYAGTMASAAIDYLIADRIVVPDEQRRFYAEKICWLPECYWPNDDKRRIAEQTPTRAEAGLPETGFVFCSFNANHKITPAVFDVWMRLLGAVEGSVLWLLAGNPAVAGNLRREAEARGIAPERLIFAPRVPPADHLARHRLADLFLDTLPYNAHTTAVDALWTGLPLVTCRGEAFAARVAGSMLSAIGLAELATDSLEEYEALALSLALNPDRLGAAKAKLAANRTTFPLFETTRFARHIERAYETMCERSQRGEKPEDFAVEALPR